MAGGGVVAGGVTSPVRRRWSGSTHGKGRRSQAEAVVGTPWAQQRLPTSRPGAPPMGEVQLPRIPATLQPPGGKWAQRVEVPTHMASEARYTAGFSARWTTEAAPSRRRVRVVELVGRQVGGPRRAFYVARQASSSGSGSLQFVPEEAQVGLGRRPREVGALESTLSDSRPTGARRDSWCLKKPRLVSCSWASAARSWLGSGGWG